MNSNELLRSLRKVLSANETTMAEISNLGSHKIDVHGMKNMLKHNNDSDFKVCDDATLAAYLEALIIHKRGGENTAKASPYLPLSNNQILKKLRVAFELKDDDMHQIFSSSDADVEVSKQELKSLFRNEENKNFKACDDKLLRAFLDGLTQRTRSERAN